MSSASMPASKCYSDTTGLPCSRYGVRGELMDLIDPKLGFVIIPPSTDQTVQRSVSMKPPLAMRERSRAENGEMDLARNGNSQVDPLWPSDSSTLIRGVEVNQTDGLRFRSGPSIINTTAIRAFLMMIVFRKHSDHSSDRTSLPSSTGKLKKHPSASTL